MKPLTGGARADGGVVFNSASVARTEKFAADYARGLRGGEVIALYGDLGAGKTAFVRGLARGMGFCGRVTSPTYTLANEYRGSALTLHHYDMYRVDAFAARDAGLNENFGSEDCVCAVEWAENISPLLPPSAIKVRIEVVSDDKRVVTFF